MLAGPVPAQTISLTQPPALAPGIAAFPKIVGHSSAAPSINAALNDNDADVKGANCRADPNFYTERSIEVKLAGPHYLVFLVSDSWYCPDTAHPGSAQTPFIFSLATGNHINPLTWLPPSLRPGPVLDGTEGAIARVKPLTGLYLSRMNPNPAGPDDPDCAQVLQTQPHLFNFWPDPSKHALVMQPSGMAYILTSCLNPVDIPVGTLLKLGFSPRLITALITP